MQKWSKADRPIQVGFLLFEAFSNHCLANSVEPLRAANTLAGTTLYEWQFLSLDGGALRSSSGLEVTPSGRLADHGGGELLFVLPSYQARTHARPATARALRAARTRFTTLVAMDMGAWLLASAGLLDGRRATIHWDEQVQFAEAFPEVSVLSDRIVDDGDILSCGGAATAFELVLDLIERRHGAMLRLEVSALFMALGPSSPDAPQSPTPRGRLEKAIVLMREALEVPLSIDAIAVEIGMPRKRFAAECHARYGKGPGALYRALRLREARRLALETGLSIEEIAGRCGYRNAAALTRAFRSEFHQTPSDLRRKDR